MRNFYYIQSYNLGNAHTSKLIDLMGLFDISDSVAEVKIKSKYFTDFNEATMFINKDFYKKADLIFDDDQTHVIKAIMVMNPLLAEHNETDAKIAKAFNQCWEDSCCGTFFFCETEQDDIDKNDLVPDSWLIKYEIYFANDEIDLVDKNGEYMFAPSSLTYPGYSSNIH